MIPINEEHKHETYVVIKLITADPDLRERTLELSYEEWADVNDDLIESLVFHADSFSINFTKVGRLPGSGSGLSLEPS